MPQPPGHLDPAARRRLGQHFTSPLVADLISALCIRRPDDRVLDPACGDGALLARARERLKHLGASLPALAGVEVDVALAAAARGNVAGARIVTGDFLAIGCAEAFGDGAFDAVIGNPPYVRQELLDRPRKEELGRIAWRGFDSQPPIRPSRRSDLHVHFWPRALALLEEGGRLGFLTSNSWLDAAYGEPLRRLLASGFSVIAVIESEVETWFDDARVRTAITIIENNRPDGARPARFARLTRRLDEIAPPDLAEDEKLVRLEELARALEHAGSRAHGAIRARAVAPARLETQRWGPHLRQPDLYFEILDRAASRLVPLDEVASVHWGIKTGDDAFFYLPRDASLPAEARFFEPVVFSLMELDRVIVTSDQLRRLVLHVDTRQGPITGLAIERHIATAERDRRSHLRPTCAARERASGSRRWFELRPGPPGEILWSIMHQYRHLAPLNPGGFHANDNLLLIRPRPGVGARPLAALLNSHLQALIKTAFGRSRNEGMLKTQAGDVRRMLVPDPRKADPELTARLVEAFDEISRRRVLTVTEERERHDRRRLDIAALMVAGYAEAEADQVAGRIADHLVGLHERERRWEVDAVKRRSVRRGAPPSTSVTEC
jgi:methylase of polypeptide subunit release factors